MSALEARDSTDTMLNIASRIVSAYVQKNSVPLTELSGVIKNVHGTLCALSGSSGNDPATAQKPAVSIKKSVTDDYIVCLEDGKELKMLKRYLRSNFDMTPEQYRAKWGLPREYPMVAPNYSAKRSEFAKKIGLGRAKKPSATPKRRKRA